MGGTMCMSVIPRREDEVVPPIKSVKAPIPLSSNTNFKNAEN